MRPEKPTFLLLALLAWGCTLSAAQEGPVYDAPGTKATIEAMIEAHGGLAAWEAAPTFSYTNTFFNPLAPAGQNPWWISEETIEQGRARRAYQYWPLNDAHLAYDGEKTWVKDWGVANYPKFMTHFFYYFLGLPWLTQDDDVQLASTGPKPFPGDDSGKEFQTVLMTFTEAPSIGMTGDESYELYIDPDTHRLMGYAYTVTYGAMLDLMQLPPEAKQMGPVFRVHDDFTTAGGLLLPSRMHTISMDGQNTWGHHAITNYSFEVPFDEARLTMPADADVDTSSPQRNASEQE